MLRLVCLPLFLVLALVTSGHAQTTSIKRTLSGQLFYQLLLGEFNAQVGEPGSAYALLLDAAYKTNDPRLFQRAADVALEARSGESALAAARAWLGAWPKSAEANRYVLQVLIGLNRISETARPLQQQLAFSEPQNRAATIALIGGYFAQASDKKAALSVVEKALQADLQNPSSGAAAWTVIGNLQFEAGNTNAALDALNQAQQQDPRSDKPALLALTLMQGNAPQAEALVLKHLQSHPSTPVRMAYARVLIDVQRYAQALAQVQHINDEQADFPDAWLVRGVLELQSNKPQEAQQSLQNYVQRASQPPQNGDDDNNNDTSTHKGLVQAYLALSQIAELNKDFATADEWLKRINGADGNFNVVLRRATLLARQGQLEQARQLIRNQSDETPDQTRLKISAEIQLLRDEKQYQAAYDQLVSAVERFPEDTDLRYDQAMMAEKLGRIDEMETLLRQVIASKPDHPSAYNALGYVLANQSLRLPEAKELILKALELAPDEPYILDSLGWVTFRLGQLEHALQLLQTAYQAQPDAEIAAHLGEVLWALEQYDQAREIWQEGLQLSPGNAAVTETLQRLSPKP